MKKVKINSLLWLLVTAYSVVILTVLARLLFLSIQPVKVIQAPDVVQLQISQIEKTYDQILIRSENKYPGIPNMSLFEFGKVDPFQE